MDVDWEVEVGGGAPVIEALWTGADGLAGFVNLEKFPERIGEIAEAAALPGLADLLLALNGVGSPVWTSKCDVWEAEPGTAAIYIDVLPRGDQVFAELRQAEGFCRDLVARLEQASGPAGTVELVIRQAFAGEKAGFGVTAYLSASGADGAAAAMADFADALLRREPPAMDGKKLQ